jgi:putative endonuclease
VEQKSNTKQIGDNAENVAADFYRSLGYKILARNYRLQLGELDLVVEGEGELIFVEVKGRKAFRIDEAEFFRWRAKKRKLRRVAQVFLQQYEGALSEGVSQIRLDIVFVTQGRVSHRFEGEPFV